MHQRNRNHVGWMLLLALVMVMVVTLSAQVVEGPIVGQPVHHDVSPSLLDMIKNAPPPLLTRQEAEEVLTIPPPPGLERLEEDPVRQRSIAPLTPITSRSFEGLGKGQYKFTVPAIVPDSNGAVGATQYVQWVNFSFAVFNKSTGALIAGPIAGNTLWSGFGGGCQTNNNGDPIVLYDKLANRWVMSQFRIPGLYTVRRGIHEFRCHGKLVSLFVTSTPISMTIPRWGSGRTPTIETFNMFTKDARGNGLYRCRLPALMTAQLC